MILGFFVTDLSPKRYDQKLKFKVLLGKYCPETFIETRKKLIAKCYLV